MRYRLFLYKPADQEHIDYVNRVLSDPYGYLSPKAADYMSHFDLEYVTESIRSWVGRKCKAIVLKTPGDYGPKEYVYIATSFDVIRDVFPNILILVLAMELALYDAETGRTIYRNLLDETLIDHTNREQFFTNLILEAMKPVWKIRRVFDRQKDGYKTSCCVVTIKKSPKKAFVDRVRDFCDCLKRNLNNQEKLTYKDRAFTVSGEDYSIMFVLEGYKKHSNMIGCWEDGEAKAELIGRMSVEEAYKWLKDCPYGDRKEVFSRMSFTEMVEAFPNPADRIVGSVHITKWQKRQVFTVHYGDIENNDLDILFHRVPDPRDYDPETISGLKLREGTATYILPFFKDVYPYFYKRYHNIPNHIPPEAVREVVERLKKAKKMIVKDTFNPELEKYIKSFNVGTLEKGLDSKTWREMNDNITDFAYKHRYEIAYLYEIFIQWAEKQLEYCSSYLDKGMFNIQGPYAGPFRIFIAD